MPESEAKDLITYGASSHRDLASFVCLFVFVFVFFRSYTWEFAFRVYNIILKFQYYLIQPPKKFFHQITFSVLPVCVDVILIEFFPEALVFNPGQSKTLY